ncbi:MAG: PQQ-dependent sugar dehydrogenase [Chloroflexota bacterium]
MNLPEGFVIADVVGGLILPTDLAVMPNGDMLVTEKGTGDGRFGIANVRLIKNGQLIATPVVSLHTNVIDDSGLLSMVLDNNFADNNYFYVWYGPGALAKQKGPNDTFRLSRFTFSPETGTAHPDSEVVVHDVVPWTEWHNGGGIGFDADGHLYIATGDMYDANLPNDWTVRSGKVLRIRPTNTGHVIPSDNPFLGIENVPADLYALGVRNPFRMTRRESDKALFFADVGKWNWEEVNQVEYDFSVDYGWPFREGLCPQGKGLPCLDAPEGFTDPMFAYEHVDERGALTGMAFYEGDSYPEKYRGKLFYVDSEHQYLAMVDVSVDIEVEGRENPIPEQIATGVGFIVDMAYYRNNLYLLDIAHGTVKVLYYTGEQTVAPVLQVQTSEQSGIAPFSVWVDARDSYSPRNLQLRYIVNWGDGSPEIINENGYRTHTYEEDGDYQATIQVQDILGARSDLMTMRVRVFSGEMPRIVFANDGRVNAASYIGGDRWTYTAQRDVGVTGLAADPYEWNVYLYHNEHFHPVIVGQRGGNGEFAVDRHYHNDEVNVWYRFELVMHTQTNQKIKVHRDLRPTFSTISIDSIPRPVDIKINGVNRGTTQNLRRIEGMVQTIEAPQTIIYEGNVGTFEHWIVVPNGWPLTAAAVSDMQPNQEIETIADATLRIPVPQENVTYLASYTMVGPAQNFFLPWISR